MEDKPMVLLVDPQDQPRNFLRLYLEAEGFRVFEARSGREALRLARARHPHVVIAEVTLPESRGVDLFTTLRGDPELKDVPVLLVGRRGDEKDRQYAEMLGVEAFLPKPVEPADVLECLRGLGLR